MKAVRLEYLLICASSCGGSKVDVPRIVAVGASSFFTLWFFRGSTARVELDLISLCDCPIRFGLLSLLGSRLRGLGIDLLI